MSETLCAVVVHWHAEDDLARLLDVWPAEVDLVVVDNGSTPGRLEDVCAGRARVVSPGRNLGFAGGVNRGVSETTADWILILNPDARPEPGALDALRAAAERHPEAAGLVPRLQNPDGSSQHRWQLRPLPTLWQLLRQALFLPGPSGPPEPPADGETVAQPAAAALLVRRRHFEALGGFDEGFYPAWHEDVDFAARTAAAGGRFLFVPGASFVHELGGSVAPLGYGRFLHAYYRNLARYVEVHHSRSWSHWMCLVLFKTAWLRLLALPLRKPRRAASRRDAARALLTLSSAALRYFPESPGDG